MASGTRTPAAAAGGKLEIQRTDISPAQCRAARAFLDWTQSELARQAGLARRTVTEFEAGNCKVHRRSRRDIARALEAGGIEFTDEGGMRLASREPHDTSEELEPSARNAPLSYGFRR